MMVTLSEFDSKFIGKNYLISVTNIEYIMLDNFRLLVLF